MEFSLNKQKLRTELKQKRLSMKPADRVRESADICSVAKSYIEQLKKFKNDQPVTVFSYLAYRDEPDTLPLLNECWQQGHQVLAPRIDKSQQGIFDLHAIYSIADVEPGAYGIPEPAAALPVYTRLDEIDLIIVPGLGYDHQGGRIGYGGGYYDRFMQKITDCSGCHPIVAALAFESQLISHIPMAPHDFRVDLLFTSSGIMTVDR